MSKNLKFFDFEKVEKISFFTLTLFLPKKFEKILSPVFEIKSYQDMFVEVQDVEKHKFFRFWEILFFSKKNFFW